MKYKHLLFVLLIFFTVSTKAQRKLPITVTLDTKTWQISELDKLKIPFDENFHIVGNFAETREVTSLVVKYRLKNYCEKPNNGTSDSQDSNADTSASLNSNDGVREDITAENCLYYYNYRNHYYLFAADKKLRIQVDGYVHLDTLKFSNDIKRFDILVDPLHPNQIYEFKFEFYEKKDISKEIQLELKKEIVVEINKTYNYKNEETATRSFSMLNEKLASMVKERLQGSKFYNEKNEPINFENIINAKKEIEDVYDTITDRNRELWRLNEALNKYKNFAGEDKSYVRTKQLISELNNENEEIKKVVDKLLSDKQFSNIISEPANPTVDPKVSIKDVLGFISADLNRWRFYSLPNDPGMVPTNIYIVEIILGRAKMHGNVIEPVDSHDLKSGLLLWSTFNFLQNIKDKNGKELISFGILKPININLQKWCANVMEFNLRLESKPDEEQSMGDLYDNIYSKYDISFPISTNEVLETRESNYIGLDFGLMVAPEIGSTFTFEGFNFYFSPVNKRAGFKGLKGADKVLKRYSIALGIAQRAGNNYNDNYEKLIGVGSPFIGVGYRLNKNLRFSAGGIFYESTSPNPLISDSSVKFTYFLSASWDISFRDLIKTAIGI